MINTFMSVLMIFFFRNTFQCQDSEIGKYKMEKKKKKPGSLVIGCNFLLKLWDRV